MIPGIGNTPLVRLHRLVGPKHAEIWVKCEGANPTGSMKDRMAVSMVRGFVERGQLRPGGTVVEYTGGSTGSSLSMVCARLGYRAHLVSSNAFDQAKLDTMRAYGATLELVHAEGRMITKELFERMRERTLEICQQPDHVWTDQFRNPDNASAYEAMASETMASLGGAPDAFVSAVGTGGCFSGNAKAFKAASAGVWCVGVEPANSQPLAGLAPTGGHRLEGMGVGYVTPLTRTDLMDEVVPVTDEEAADTARRLTREEGLWGGFSCGANVFVALQIAKRLGPGKRVVTTMCDTGLRYLSGGLYTSD